VIDTIHFYVVFIINLVFSFIINLILVYFIFFEMLHLPSGYEILQARTQPTKVQNEPIPVP
jgi:hypothetical protein